MLKEYLTLKRLNTDTLYHLPLEHGVTTVAQMILLTTKTVEKTALGKILEQILPLILPLHSLGFMWVPL